MRMLPVAVSSSGRCTQHVTTFVYDKTGLAALEGVARERAVRRGVIGTRN